MRVEARRRGGVGRDDCGKEQRRNRLEVGIKS